jgi:ketosteroid isomerase-like protein
MAAAGSEEPEKILLRHWQAFGAGDVEAIMADYAEDALLVMPDGPLKGRAEIRSLFTKVFADMFPPKSTSLSLAKQIVEGEIAYILWSGSSPFYNAAFATDTFVIRDGKIVAQTFAAQLNKK